MYVIKKDGTREEFNVDKIIAAVNKSAARILYEFSTDEIAFICQFAYDRAGCGIFENGQQADAGI